MQYKSQQVCTRHTGADLGRNPTPKGGWGLYGAQNCRTEQCALSAPEAPEILFERYPRRSLRDMIFFVKVRCFEAMGTPVGGRGYIATLPTCGPLLILPAALKRWEPPRREGLFSHLIHLWAACRFAPRSAAVGIPLAAGVM